MSSIATLEDEVTHSERESLSAVSALEPSGSSCFWLNSSGFPTEPQRTIVMTGVARSGTSFIGSVVGRLGVPHARNDADKVSGHWEHVALRTAFKEKDEEGFARIVSEFNDTHDIWGWKLPSLRSNFDLVLKHVRNPCFVFTFKEPLSMAMRKIATGHNTDIARHFRRIFSDYIQLVEFAQSTDCPTMLVSYDRATRKMDDCIHALASFAGVKEYDLASVKAGVMEDANSY